MKNAELPSKRYSHTSTVESNRWAPGEVEPRGMPREQWNSAQPLYLFIRFLSAEFKIFQWDKG